MRSRFFVSKDYTDGPNIVFRKGSCYVGSHSKPETSEIPSHEEMQTLINLAAEKALGRWFTQSERSGISIVALPPGASEDELFAGELGDELKDDP